MTVPKPPLTVEEALDRVIGLLTMPAAVEATGRKASYLRALSHPRKREKLTVIDMIKLDVAHMKAGLPGAPIFETVATILQAAQPALFSSAYEISRMTIDVVKEDAESQVALIEASLPGADRKTMLRALKEAVDSLSARHRAVAVIKSIVEQTEQPP